MSNTSHNFSVVDDTSGFNGSDDGVAYTGPIAGLEHQFIDITPHTLSVTADTPNSFIHAGDGTSAIDVSHVNGDNVLDGGGGSNWLVGGTGNDTFYVDDRLGGDIWSTAVHFHTNDSATFWGISPNDLTIATFDNLGASNGLGLTFIISKPGVVEHANLTLAGFSQADIVSGRLTLAFGRTDDLPGVPGSNYMTVTAH